MMWDLTASEEYIRMNTLDNEDYLDADEMRQTALLNVASRTLLRKFSGLTIPDAAVYLFACTLASAYNDTNKMQQQGVASFSVKGISFTFKDWAKKGLDALVPDEVIELINEENGVQLSTGRTAKWMTL